MAWSMFWHGQYFVAVNGLTLLMFWHSRCFGTFDIIDPLMFWRSRTNAGERQSLRDLKYQPHLYTDCIKTLTAPKHRPHRNTDNAGPKGQLVIIGKIFNVHSPSLSFLYKKASMNFFVKNLVYSSYILKNAKTVFYAPSYYTFR